MREKGEKRVKFIPEISSGLTKNYHHSTDSGRIIELYFLSISNAQFTDCMQFSKQVDFLELSTRLEGLIQHISA